MGKYLEFREIREGTEENFVSHAELKPEGVDMLRAHIGTTVEARMWRETWFYLGPHTDEDHSSVETHVFGDLVEVGEEGLVLDVKAGETNYGNTKTTVSEGRMGVPYRWHQYQLRRHAEVSEMKELVAGSRTFRLGSAQEQI